MVVPCTRGTDHDACTEDVRPLLALRHVTVKRARALVDAMGIRTVRDVTAIFPPDRLADRIPFLGKWRAAEMILSLTFIGPPALSLLCRR